VHTVPAGGGRGQAATLLSGMIAVKAKAARVTLGKFIMFSPIN
jgi:hypothetical protein